MKTRLLAFLLVNCLFFSLAACSPGKDEKLAVNPTYSYKRFVAQASQAPALFGVADTNGKWIIDPKYLEINTSKSGGGIYATQETEAQVEQEIFSLLNDDNKLIKKDIHRDDFFPLFSGYVAIRNPDRGAYLGLDKFEIGWRNYGWSIIDKSGSAVLLGPYKSIESYGDYAVLTGEDGKQYIINSSARITYKVPENIYIGKKFNRIDGLFSASDYSECKDDEYAKCRKEGAINPNGKWIIQPRKGFSIFWCRQHPSLLCIVTDYSANRKLYWLIDEDWNVKSPGYGRIMPDQSIHDGEIKWGHYFRVANNIDESYSSLMTDKGILIPNSAGSSFTSTVVNDEIALIKKEGSDQLIDIKNGAVIKTAKHIYGFEVSDGVGIFAEESPSGTDKFQFMGIDGKPIGGHVYEDIMSFKDGVFAVKRNGLWGFVDKNGSQIIDHKFKQYKGWFMFFHGGLAIVSPKENEELFGIINKSGDYVIPPGKYVHIWSWVD